MLSKDASHTKDISYSNNRKGPIVDVSFTHIIIAHNISIDYTIYIVYSIILIFVDI